MQLTEPGLQNLQSVSNSSPTAGTEAAPEQSSQAIMQRE